ncbi:MAG: hypothetical protein KGJ05_01290 [Alphaproteobacteria bacterium]|nr:hypothetical protein [Alphaproteobacteria bacterium]
MTKIHVTAGTIHMGFSEIFVNRCASIEKILNSLPLYDHKFEDRLPHYVLIPEISRQISSLWEPLPTTSNQIKDNDGLEKIHELAKSLTNRYGEGGDFRHFTTKKVANAIWTIALTEKQQQARKTGRPPKFYAASVADIVLREYVNLTNLEPKGTNRGSYQDTLDKIFKVLGTRANVRYHAERALRRRAEKHAEKS